MAGAAFGGLVRACECEPGFTVIETRQLPIAIHMAADAIAAHCALMRVVFFVAADAAGFYANFRGTL